MTAFHVDSSDDSEPIALTLSGLNPKTGDAWEETFLLSPVLPITAIGPLVNSMLRNPDTGLLEPGVTAMMIFIERLLLDDEDRERWRVFYGDPARPVRATKIADFIEQLIEQELVEVPFGLPGGWRTSSPTTSSPAPTSEDDSSPPDDAPET